MAFLLIHTFIHEPHTGTFPLLKTRWNNNCPSICSKAYSIYIHKQTQNNNVHCCYTTWCLNKGDFTHRENNNLCVMERVVIQFNWMTVICCLMWFEIVWILRSFLCVWLGLYSLALYSYFIVAVFSKAIMIDLIKALFLLYKIYQMVLQAKNICVWKTNKSWIFV